MNRSDQHKNALNYLNNALGRKAAVSDWAIFTVDGQGLGLYFTFPQKNLQAMICAFVSASCWEKEATAKEEEAFTKKFAALSHEVINKEVEADSLRCLFNDEFIEQNHFEFMGPISELISGNSDFAQAIRNDYNTSRKPIEKREEKNFVNWIINFNL